MTIDFADDAQDLIAGYHRFRATRYRDARDAFDAFKELATRFPQSRYAPDSILRMNYLLNTLAAHEIHVARYYLKRSAYVAAANRAQFALKSYDALGMRDLRDDAERVLKSNFPNSPYLKGDPRQSAPWWQIWNR